VVSTAALRHACTRITIFVETIAKVKSRRHDERGARRIDMKNSAGTRSRAETLSEISHVCGDGVVTEGVLIRLRWLLSTRLLRWSQAGWP
jgi:hypothetical protein